MIVACVVALSSSIRIQRRVSAGSITSSISKLFAAAFAERAPGL
jgi:hypothetical protein